MIVDFADTGEGIAEQDLDKIFNPGFSGSKQRPGLGLTICQRIMQAASQHDPSAKPRLQRHQIFPGVSRSMNASAAQRDRYWWSMTSPACAWR